MGCFYELLSVSLSPFVFDEGIEKALVASLHEVVLHLQRMQVHLGSKLFHRQTLLSGILHVDAVVVIEVS